MVGGRAHFEVSHAYIVCRHDSRQSVHEAAVTDWGGGEGEVSVVKKAIYTPLNINPSLPPAPSP